MLLALKDLEADGLRFDVEYSRLPFFLRGSQENINRWMDSIGLPHNAPRREVAKKMGFNDDNIDRLFAQAGLSPRDKAASDEKQFADTMDSHRLAWHAATVSPEKAELLWRALSRRYFLGKDTKVYPIRLDSREMLLECAEEVGLDLAAAQCVLDGDDHRQEIVAVVRQMHEAGINSIPVLIFEVEGVACGSWMQSRQEMGREVHHGSGSMQEFRAIFQRLHASCAAAA